MSSRTRLSGSQPGRKGRGWSSSRTSASLGSSSANQRRAESGQRGARGSGTRGWRRKAKRLRISTFLGWPPFRPAAGASLAADPLLAAALNTFLSVASRRRPPVCSTGHTVSTSLPEAATCARPAALVSADSRSAHPPARVSGARFRRACHASPPPRGFRAHCIYRAKHGQMGWQRRLLVHFPPERWHPAPGIPGPRIDARSRDFRALARGLHCR